MIIYYSMIMWVLLMWLLNKPQPAGIAFLSPKDKAFEFTPVSMGVAILAFAYMTFWIGMRTAFGDTPAYIRMFNAMEVNNITLETLWKNSAKGGGFSCLAFFFKLFLSENYHCWLMFLAILSCGSVMLVFRRYSPLFFYTTLIYLLACTFTWSMNGIRQYFCVTLLFACTPLLLARRFKLLIAITLLLSMVHQTCLMMLPIYYVVTCEPWSKKMLLSIAATTAFICTPGLFTDAMDTVLASTQYADVTDKFGTGVNPIRTIFFSLPAIMAFWGRKKLKAYHSPALNVCINMSVITACLYAIGSVTSGILVGRLPIYCLLYCYILLAYEARLIFEGKKGQVFIAASLILAFLFFFVQSANFYYQSDITGRI